MFSLCTQLNCALSPLFLEGSRAELVAAFMLGSACEMGSEQFLLVGT